MPPLRVFRGEKQLGTFGALGGMMRIEAVPLPERYAFGLMKLAGYIEDTGKPMMGVREIARQDMQQRFDTDSDPDGNPWTPLDPDYKVKKAKQGYDPENILTRTSRLERMSTSRAAWIATDNALFFSTKALPAYWEVHQEGSDASGLSGYAAMVRSRVRSGDRLEDDPGGSHDSMGIGRGQATPARPFIGLSRAAQEQMIELFDLWFDEGIKLTVHPTTGIVQQRMGGRFGVKMFPRFGA